MSLKTITILLLIASALCMISLFAGAYCHDIHHALTRDQVFIVPSFFGAITMFLLFIGLCHEENRRG